MLLGREAVAPIGGESITTVGETLNPGGGVTPAGEQLGCETTGEVFPTGAGKVTLVGG